MRRRVASLLFLTALLAGCGHAEDAAIRIDGDVFTYDEDLGYSKETFLVTGSFEPAAVVEALHHVATRFMNTDERGAEHDDLERLVATGWDLYTPNYVSDPTVRRDGVEMYVDCKGSIEDPMAATFRRILREELAPVVTSARIRAVTYA